jgi:hypothetical protein
MSVFDGTEVLLGSRRDFSNEGEQAVGIGAINATDLLDGIQVGQPAPIEHQIVLSANPGNSVDREADKLEDGNRSVEQQEG